MITQDDDEDLLLLQMQAKKKKSFNIQNQPLNIPKSSIAESSSTSVERPIDPTQEKTEPAGVVERFKLGFAESLPQKIQYLSKQIKEGGSVNINDRGEITYRVDKDSPIQTLNNDDIVGNVAEQIPNLIPIISGTAGGAVGSASLTPAGTVAGGALGYAGGEAAKKTIGRMILGSNPESSPMEDVKQTAEDLLVGTAQEVAPVALQKALKPFAKQIDKSAIELAKQEKIPFTPSEMIKEKSVGSQALKLSEEAIGSSVTGGAVYNSIRRERVDQLRELGSKTANEIAELKDPTEVKKALNSVIEGKTEAFKNISKKLYGDIDDVIGADAIDTKDIKKLANDILVKIPAKERLAAQSAGNEATSLVSQLTRVRDLPKNIKFSDAQFYRSQLLDLVRADQSPVGNRIKGSASQFANLFDREMTAVAKRNGVEDLYKETNKFYREGKELFNSDVVKKIVDVEPEKLASVIIKPRNLEFINTVKKVTDKNTFQSIKRNAVEDWLRDKSFYTIDQSGDAYLNAKAFKNKWQELGDETRNAIFSQEEKQSISNFVNLLEKTPTKEKSVGLWGIGTTIGALTGGGTYGAVTGDIWGSIGGTGTVLLAPYLFAKLTTSPAGRKFLTEGVTIKPNTQRAMTFMLRLNSFLREDENKKSQTTTAQSDATSVKK